MQTTLALLHPVWVSGQRHGYLYHVTVDGEELVTRSHDPEYDLARALLARGVIGRVLINDAATGKARMRIQDIEKAANYRTVERDRDGLRAEKVSSDTHSRVEMAEAA